MRHKNQPSSVKFILSAAPPQTEEELVWPRSQTLVSRFDGKEPAPLVPSSPVSIVLHESAPFVSATDLSFDLREWFICTESLFSPSLPLRKFGMELAQPCQGQTKAQELISCILVVFVKTTRSSPDFDPDAKEGQEEVLFRNSETGTRLFKGCLPCFLFLGPWCHPTATVHPSKIK